MSPELPPPDVSLVLVRVAIESFIDVAGPKKGERFLKSMADRLASEERLSEVLRLRPASDEEAARRARREAMQWFRTMLPLFMARL